MYILQKSHYEPGTGNIAEALVDAESDLADLPEEYAPGSVAYTADLTSMWQKGPDGNWHKIGGE